MEFADLINKKYKKVIVNNAITKKQFALTIKYYMCYRPHVRMVFFPWPNQSILRPIRQISLA